MKPMQRVRTIHVAYAHDKSEDTSVIFRVNHCLDFTISMYNSILCTNQSHTNSITINDCPSIYDQPSTKFIIPPNNDIQLSTKFNGPVPYISVRYPANDEWDTCPHIHLTAEEGCYRILVPLSHNISYVIIDVSIVDSFLLQRDILECLRDTIKLIGITQKIKHISMLNN